MTQYFKAQTIKPYLVRFSNSYWPKHLASVVHHGTMTEN